MAPADKSKGMKSAYELALERLEAEGIERPRDGALSEDTKQEIAEARRVTEAKLAELEILHRDRMRKLEDPVARAEQEEFFRRERERLTAEGEARVEKLRGSAP
ncbi:MAG TPA: hypothetical protein VLA66_00570 [Thermoanaerobaculia bacterium]|nr:hypothetical protein [Thermoanaerobaculia bacterium]